MPAAADGRAGAPLRPWRSALFGETRTGRPGAVPCPVSGVLQGSIRRHAQPSRWPPAPHPGAPLSFGGGEAPPGLSGGRSVSWARREAAEGLSRLSLPSSRTGPCLAPCAALRLRPGMQRAGMSPKGCLTPTADSVPGRDYIARGACSSVAHVGRLSRVLGWLLWLTRTFAPKIDPAFPRRTARYSASADQSTPSAHGHHALANSANRRDSEQERPLVHHAAPPPLARGRRPAALPSIQPSDSAAGRPGPFVVFVT
jgi:hypothetical protein